MNSEEIKVNRNYKDTLFRKLFGEDKEAALSLYNALNKTSYTDVDELEFTTLSDVIYIKCKNDVSIMVGGTLSLYEHQASHNPNMPLRGLFYFVELLRKTIGDDKAIYGSAPIKLPLPKYVVFYNGDDKSYESEVVKMKLSDSFEFPDTKHEFEWTATVIDITGKRNAALKGSCKKLNEYCVFVETVKKYKNMGLSDKEAITRAVDECIKNGVLADFLTKHRDEVISVCMTEFDEERFRKVVLEEGIERGIALGEERGIALGEERGIALGEERGIDKIKSLVRFLIADGRIEDLNNLDENTEALLNEYGIE